MRKKRICILLICLVLIGCGFRNPSGKKPSGEPAASAEAQTATSLETPPPEEAAVSVSLLPFHAEDAEPYTTEAVPTEFETTICTYTHTEEGWNTVFANRTLEYREMSLEVEAFRPVGEGPALTLSVSLPKDWSQSFAEDFCRDTLHFLFEIDGRQADAFREKRIESQGDRTFAIIYDVSILGDRELSGSVLSIRPYVTCIERIWSRWDAEETVLTEGNTYTLLTCANDSFRTRFLLNAQPVRSYLDHCAVSVHLNHESLPEIEKTPDIHPITIERIDFEKSYENGSYAQINGEVPSEVRYLSLCEKDFSDVIFALDSLQIKEESCSIAFTWRFSDQFREEEIQAFASQRLFFLIYFDDAINFPPEANNMDEEIEANSILYASPGVFGDVKTYMGMFSDKGSANYWNHDKQSWMELHFNGYGSQIPFEEWKSHTSLTILPYYLYFKTVYDVPGVEGPIELTEEPIEMSDFFDFQFRAHPLYRLAIRIDITPTLIENGF